MSSVVRSSTFSRSWKRSSKMPAVCAGRTKGLSIVCMGIQGNLPWAYNASTELLGLLARTPVRRARNSVTGRVLLEHRTIHVEDIRADPEYNFVEEIGV